MARVSTDSVMRTDEPMQSANTRGIADNLHWSVQPKWMPQFIAEALSSPTVERLASGALWSVVAAIASRVLHLASNAAVARILGTTEFGQLGMVQTTVATFGVLAGAGAA